ncbi:MAG: hypothetical protein K2J36_11125 [Ruminococcus sp.]|nr:hypothetical protein [Ruminococcus sp.]
MDKPFLIVMLTHDDVTVPDAYGIFSRCRNSKAEYWGFKEKPLPPEQMKVLYSFMKKCGKKTVLEVVEYTEPECIIGAEMAVDFGCDILMGTVFSDKVNAICQKNNIKYMPFVGDITGRPSVLNGSIEDMVEEAESYLAKGVYGIDLLGYRYTGNAYELNREFVSRINAPVCIAGSINSFQRIDEIKQISPYAFTIGSAFFEKRFGEDFSRQINTVCDYIEN